MKGKVLLTEGLFKTRLRKNNKVIYMANYRDSVLSGFSFFWHGYIFQPRDL